MPFPCVLLRLAPQAGNDGVTPTLLLAVKTVCFSYARLPQQPPPPSSFSTVTDSVHGELTTSSGVLSGSWLDKFMRDGLPDLTKCVTAYLTWYNAWRPAWLDNVRDGLPDITNSCATAYLTWQNAWRPILLDKFMRDGLPDLTKCVTAFLTWQNAWRPTAGARSKWCPSNQVKPNGIYMALRSKW